VAYLQWYIAETERRQNTSCQPVRAAVVCGRFSVGEIAPANGNTPISALSDVAEQLCLSVMNCTEEKVGRSTNHRAWP
jgi:hypothetical protein